MWEPIVKENKLYGLSLNPYGEKMPTRMGFLKSIPESHMERHLKDHQERWKLAESQRRLVEVDEYKIYQNGEILVRGMSKIVSDLWHKLNLTDTFTADESNGKLINLKIA